MKDTTIADIIMMDTTTRLLLGLVCLLAACQSNVSQQATTNLKITELENACKRGGEGNLFLSKNGELYLSWVEYVHDSLDELRFSRLENQAWSLPKTIASGSDWFVNWADFPSLVSNGKHFAAHWLQKSAIGTYDYDIRIAQSMDAGETWANSFIPHRDSIAAEHGFVSMLPLENGRFFATWLDGRHTKSEEIEADNHGHGHGSGAMSLRTAEFDTKGQLFEEAELDHRICDCCQTTAAMTINGPIVAYRDRLEREVRDISIVRKVDGIWTQPKRVHEDNWTIRGCPVNGPSMTAQDEEVAIAWFTSADNIPKVQLAFSEDSGANFSDPIRIDDADAEGRVDVLLLENGIALVSWMEKAKKIGKLKLAKVHSNKGILERLEIADISTSRDSGFPRMERIGDQIFFVWIDEENERIKTLVVEGF